MKRLAGLLTTLGALFRQSPVVLPLASVVAIVMVLISEASYWQSMRTLNDISTALDGNETAQIAASLAALRQSLQLGRVGVALLSALSLVAMVMYLRQKHALAGQQRLQHAFMQTERDRLETEVALRTAELTELAQHLLTAREEERSRLARNLHDELGALLTSAKLDAARIKSRLAGTAPEALERLAHLVTTLNSGIAMGRRIIEDLRPSALSNLGLVATLEILAGDFAQSAAVAVHCDLAPVPLNEAVELVVYRFVQEALTNIGKHARAREVWLVLNHCDGAVHVSVRDDGLGFERSALHGSTYGLLGMRFRIEAAGGRMSLQSAPGQGTLIDVVLPSADDATATSDAD
jgi:signal transduction histidine kinase